MFIYLNFQLLVLILKLFWFFKFHHFLVNFLSLLFVVYFHLLISDFIFHSHLHLIDSLYFNLRIKRWAKRKSKLTIYRNCAKKLFYSSSGRLTPYEIDCTLESFNLFRFSSRIIFSTFLSKST